MLDGDVIPAASEQISMHKAPLAALIAIDTLLIRSRAARSIISFTRCFLFCLLLIRVPPPPPQKNESH